MKLPDIQSILILILAIAVILFLLHILRKKNKNEEELILKNKQLQEQIKNYEDEIYSERKLAKDFKNKQLNLNNHFQGIKFAIKSSSKKNIDGNNIGDEFFSIIPLHKNPDRCRRCNEPCAGFSCHLARNEGSLIIGDMNMKNISAALMLGQIMSITQQVGSTNTSPSEIFQAINNYFSNINNGNNELYMTAFYTFIDLKKGSLKYSLAGHESPIYYNKRTNSIKYIEGDNLALGFNSNAVFHESELYVDEGDKLIMFASLPEKLKKDNLLEIVKKHAEKDIDELLEHVERNLQDYLKDQDYILAGFEVMCSPYGFYRVPAHLSMIGKIVEEVAYVAQLRRLSGEKAITDLRIALSEILANAIIHGSDKDPSKYINIQIWIDNKELNVSVKDTGKGFDYSKIYQYTMPDDLLAEQGRGLFIAKNYVDKLQFEDGGSKVILTKKIY